MVYENELWHSFLLRSQIMYNFDPTHVIWTQA